MVLLWFFLVLQSALTFLLFAFCREIIRTRNTRGEVHGFVFVLCCLHPPIIWREAMWTYAGKAEGYTCIRAAETDNLSHLSVRYDSQKSCKENCQASFSLRLTREVWGPLPCVEPVPVCHDHFQLWLSSAWNNGQWLVHYRETHSQSTQSHRLWELQN